MKGSGVAAGGFALRSLGTMPMSSPRYMRYNEGSMNNRPVEISETYTPGKNQGVTRTVTVDRIPASEVTYEGVTEIHLTFEVAGRVDVLIERALNGNDAAEQRITYTASDSAGNETAIAPVTSLHGLPVSMSGNGDNGPAL